MRLLFSLIVLFVALSGRFVHAEAFKNGPADFRGIEGGAAFADHSATLDLVRQDEDVLVYMRASERNVSERDNYMKIAYRFYKHRFSAGIIQIYGVEAKRKLHKSLIQRYVEPIRVSRRQELGASDGERVQMVLSCSVTSYCAAEFMSKEMIALEEQETGKPVQVLKKDGD